MIVLATGSSPYPQKGGYWAIVKQIQSDASPALDPAQFPAELCDFVARCLVKDPAKRATAQQLLKHPFLTGWTKASHALAHTFFSRNQDGALLTCYEALRVVLRREYPVIDRKTGKRAPYKRSLFALARFQKLGEALGVAASDVQLMLEIMYAGKAVKIADRTMTEHSTVEPNQQ
jgi:serine/threonine protein kinase